MHYVMSDIHGRYDRFRRMLEKINFSRDDTLYVLGDVIDRGPDGAELFLDIVTTENMVLLAGNHEHMLVDAYEWPRSDAVGLWVRNGAMPTIEGFGRMGMDICDIAPVIKKLPLYISDLTVNERKFFMVHAMPPLSLYDRVSGALQYDEAPPALREFCTWKRDLASGDPASEEIRERLRDMNPDTVFLFGHTPTDHSDFISSDGSGLPVITPSPDAGFLNLDCNCARDMRLGCLCLETMERTYA